MAAVHSADQPACLPTIASPHAAHLLTCCADFYTRRMFYRLHDCWNRPICSAPDAWIDVMERTPPSGQRWARQRAASRGCRGSRGWCAAAGACGGACG